MKNLSNIFQTIQSDLLKHNGKSFAVIRPLNEKEYDMQDGIKMYLIRLETGEELQVFEDEISIYA
ncbi:UNVERIFIED_ORG: hypothetical protein Xoosp15_154 [Xanthomonas phage Xoo-sp15]